MTTQARDFNAVLAQLEAGAAEQAAPETFKDAPVRGATPDAVATPPAGEGEAPAEVAEGEEVPAEEAEEVAAAEVETAADAVDGEEVKLDPAAQEQLAGVQRRERQFRERMTKERAELEAERASWRKEWEPKIEAAKRFEELRGNARFRAADVLRELGLTDDDLEPVARELWALSPAAKADPKQRAAAQEAARRRQESDVLAKTQRELAELKQQIDNGRQQAQIQAAINEYLDDGVRAVTAGRYVDPVTEREVKIEAPLVKAWMAKAPAKARERMLDVAAELSNELGGARPAYSDVIARLEKARRRMLLEDGIDPAVILGAAKPAAAPAAEARTAPKTLAKTGGAGTPTPSTTPKNRDEQFNDLLRDLEKQ